MYKCYSCKMVLEETELNNLKCPSCGNDVKKMCVNDVPTCNHNIVDGIKACNECGEFVCPICGCHDVNPISRVTGYYSPVNAWASGKRQELLDRTRYNIEG